MNSTQPTLRLGLLALIAWFLLLIVSQHPASVGAVDLPVLGHEVEAAVNHMGTRLPTGPNVRAVEYWNGAVCEKPTGTDGPEECTYPSAVDEYGQ